ncbi:Prohibitin-1, subunit of the prohibitin complex (Phb1p-Phb2p) [Ascosphaera acerosa]|nr:Prohibitin-1, subunit of the prohibitin complex (Phb1p-Phb2p) [Ascosphaera acerosa]
MATPLSLLYKYAVPVACGVSLFQASLYDVQGGTRAVIFDRLKGVQDKVVNEGTHFLIPWLQRSIIYDQGPADGDPDAARAAPPGGPEAAQNLPGTLHYAASAP